MTPELLIVALDGAVVDVSASVESAVRRTVQGYFAQFLGIRGSGSLVGPETVRHLMLVGLDEPELLSATLIRYLLSLLPGTFHPGREPHSAAEAVGFLKRTSQRFHHLTLDFFQERADFAGLVAGVQAAGGGQEGAARAIGGKWAHPLLMDEGEIGRGNLVSRLYQEIYLGQKSFARLRRMAPQFYRGPGQVEAEQLWLDHGALEKMHRRHVGRVALVTRRSLNEARLTLNQFRIETFFDTLVTEEDITAEAARCRRLGESRQVAPPHPFVLLEAASRLDLDGTRPACFVGSTPAQMRAARAAEASSGRPFLVWAVVASGSDPSVGEHLVAAGAQRLFQEPDALVAALVE